MLKGHAKIELTDVNTGEKQVYEHHNMVTNAIQSQLETIGYLANPTEINKKLTPLYNNGMGGILLFQEELSENVNNIALPDSSNPIVGYASNDAYTGSDTKRGSKNISESGFGKDENNKTKYTYVWDFNTSQANGNISSIALTSTACGLGAYQYHDDMTWYNTNWKLSDTNMGTHPGNVIDFDFTTGILTHIENNSTQGIILRKVRLPFNRMGISTLLGTPELIEEKTIQLLNAGLNAKSLWVKGDDGYYYAFYAKSSKTINVVRISSGDYTIDSNFPQNIGLSSLLDGNTTISVDCSTKNIAVANGKMYVATYSFLFYVEFETNSIGSPKKVVLNDSNKLNNTPVTQLNDILYSTKYTFLDTQIFEENMIIDRNVSSSYQWSKHSDTSTSSFFLLKNGCYADFTKDYVYIGTTKEYLATINNLDATITKTSTQAMKITYTITEV